MYTMMSCVARPYCFSVPDNAACAYLKKRKHHLIGGTAAKLHFVCVSLMRKCLSLFISSKCWFVECEKRKKTEEKII